MLEISEYLKNKGVEAIKEELFITVKSHPMYPNLHMFNYEQTKSPFSNPVVCQARGIILNQDYEWGPVCHTYNKFFNYGSGHCPDIDWDSARVIEKLDGSLMQMYWYAGGWNIASSGLPDASGKLLQDGDKTFADLFWEVWEASDYVVPDEKYSHMCFAFELCTSMNKIVVRHDKPTIRLHGARNLVDMNTEESAWLWGEKLEYEVAEAVPLQFKLDVNTNKITSFPESPESVIALCKGLNPIKHEGYVVIDKNFNRVKFKSPQYVALTHLPKGERDLEDDDRKWMAKIIKTNECDEFLIYYPQFKEEFIALRKTFTGLLESAMKLYGSFQMSAERTAGNEGAEKKRFAMTVKDHPFSGALFALFNGKIDTLRDEFLNMDSKKLMQILKRGA